MWQFIELVLESIKQYMHLLTAKLPHLYWLVGASLAGCGKRVLNPLKQPAAERRINNLRARIVGRFTEGVEGRGSGGFRSAAACAPIGPPEHPTSSLFTASQWEPGTEELAGSGEQLQAPWQGLAAYEAAR
jgi:hypothetical protein